MPGYDFAVRFQPFNERKATQAAALLLRLRGERMSYMKLIKLMYIADRLSMQRRGRPISTDKFVSMDKGPVLSQVLDLITSEESPENESFWRKHIAEPVHYEVALSGDPGDDQLTESEERILQEVFAEYGKKSRWELVKLTHSFPEWENPYGSSTPIQYATILRNVGMPEEDIRAIERTQEAEAKLTRVIAKYAS